MKIAAGILLCLIGVVSQAKGAAINYTINFTATQGAAPTSGSFTYDDSQPEPFSNFTVVWNSVTLELTSTANNSNLHYNCPPPSGSTNGTFNFESLFSPTASPCGVTRGWVAAQNSEIAEMRFNAQLLGDLDAPYREILLQQPDSSLADDEFEIAIGAYTVQALPNTVPEPSTSIMTIGAAVLYLTSRVKGRRTKKLETSGK